MKRKLFKNIAVMSAAIAIFCTRMTTPALADVERSLATDYVPSEWGENSELAEYFNSATVNSKMYVSDVLHLDNTGATSNTISVRFENLPDVTEKGFKPYLSLYLSGQTKDGKTFALDWTNAYLYMVEVKDANGDYINGVNIGAGNKEAIELVNGVEYNIGNDIWNHFNELPDINLTQEEIDWNSIVLRLGICFGSDETETAYTWWWQWYDWQGSSYDNRVTETEVSETVEDTTTEVVAQNKEDYIYTVKAGDTLGSITTNFYGDNSNRSKLFNYNKEILSKTKGVLNEGMQILIPATLGNQNRIQEPIAKEGEILYVVQAGDTLGKIAYRTYGSTDNYKQIYERNSERLKNAQTIYVGQIIVLPVIEE